MTTARIAKSKADDTLRKGSIDLAIKAYENHKVHGRFQETQRSWILLAFISISGVLIAAIVNNYAKDGDIIPSARNVVIFALFFHILLGILIGLAISKASREFRRHFRQGDKIIDAFIRATNADEELLGPILHASKLGSSGDHTSGVRRYLAKRLGIAAIHNYIVSLFIAMDSTMISEITLKIRQADISVFIISLVLSIWAFTTYNKLMDT